MRRRELIAAIGLSALWPMAAAAQSRTPAKPKRIGVLWHAGNAEEEHEYQEILVKAFNDLGYVEGKNITFLHKYPAEQAERYTILARELVDSNVDLLIAITQDGAIALKQATSSIPIVFVIVNDPLGLGLITSLARPGGNATGLSLFVNDFSGKRLDLLRQAVPGLSRVALLINPKEGGAARAIKATNASAEAMGVSVTTIEVGSPDAIEPAFDRITREKFDAGIAGGSMLFNARAKVGALALAHKLPIITVVSEMVPYGLLMSYGQDFPEYFRKAATYSAKLLAGAHPADLPVEQPTRLKFVINLKAARALGLSLPASLLISADETID
jgi:putative ABC transport system substrate-binding protein